MTKKALDVFWEHMAFEAGRNQSAPSQPRPSDVGDGRAVFEAALAPAAVPVPVETLHGSAVVQDTLLTSDQPAPQQRSHADCDARTLPDATHEPALCASSEPMPYAMMEELDLASLAGKDEWLPACVSVSAAEQAVARLRQLSNLETASTATSSSSARPYGSCQGLITGPARMCSSRSSSLASEEAAREAWATRRSWTRRSSDRLLEEPGPQSQLLVFRRPLHDAELSALKALLSPPSRRELREAAEREFTWALGVGGHLPGQPGRIDFASAMTALRQLVFLNGLPALDGNVSQWFYDACAGRVGRAECAEISLEEFQVVVEQMLQSAYENGQ